jgi:hypothetical protein
MALGIKPDTATAPTITDWVKVTDGEDAGGGGTTGTDTGPTRLCWYYYDPDGDASGVGSSPPSGQLTVTPGSSPNCCWAQMFAFRSPFGADSVWALAGESGIDSTTGTPFTAAMGADPGLAVDDIVMFAGCTPTDVNLPSNVRKYTDLTLSGTGLNTGQPVSVSTRTEPSSTEGQDIGGVIARWAPIAALSSGVATFSATAGGTTTNVRGPIVMCRLRVSEAAGGIEEPLNQASETDAAQAMGKAKEKALGINAETDLSQPLGKAKTKALGQASAETDTALALVVQKSHTIGPNAETDTALAFTSAKTKALGQASESDTALAIPASKAKEIGQPADTETALPLGKAKTRNLGIASETDTAPSFLAPIEEPLEQASETDAALGLTAAKTKDIGQASDSEVALPLTAAKTKVLGIAEESDTALGVNAQGDIPQDPHHRPGG